MPLKYLSRSSRSPYPERSAGPLNSAENSAASLASSTWATASSLRLPKRALKAMVKAASFAKGVVTPWTPSCTDTSWAKYGVAQMRSCDRNLSHSMTVLPSYWRGRRSFRVSLSGGDAGEDITGDEGDRGLPAGEDGCCDCPPGELREERVLVRPRGGDGGEGDGGSPGAGLHKIGTEGEAVTTDDELAQECGGVSLGLVLGGLSNRSPREGWGIA
ncbi:predicted protein [Postia placenta Mad-698-R]|uniref:Uncharacterized protein n=1 Tax=Postia placenta MAD-698-R-SB12 TaxID=670580 RepID=A0A1X6MQK2_9APHY|nr:hypothetical protein POSPLADRAFT_1153302 [Postia placenta MAD-698-R-SB12]EED82838.1 predicted protein [Postia placenta Mad-698-R]OSX58496.1 hypothetical protein POSPLADRAFT_1153302 [Postia placenta MAD-698-R-SB12]